MNDEYFHRTIEKKMPFFASPEASKSRKKVILLFGARQTGKSTLLKRWMAISGGKTKYLNLQNREERRRYEADEGLLVRELEADQDLRNVVIDEIQKVPSLLEDVQHVYDSNPNALQFFITGSSARQLKRGSANLLPGRVHTYHLSPVIQAEQRRVEILPFSDEPPSDCKIFPQRRLEDMLLYGSLPGLFHETSDSWAQTLASYVDLYIENEIRQESIVHDMGAFLRFLRLAALESGQSVNYTKLSSEVGVAPNTLRNFYQVLEDSYLGARVNAFGRSRKRVLTAPRFLIFDIGVRNMLTGLPFNEALLQLDPGHLFEQWVMTELYHRCRYHGNGFRLSTWKTATGAEVDAVVETPQDIIPVEIKWTKSPSIQDARHIRTFLELHRGMAKHGYLVCRCPNRQKLDDQITAIPWNEF